MAYEALYLMLEEELDLKWALAQQEQERMLAAERRRGRQTGAFIVLAYSVILTTAIALAIHYWPRMAHAWGWR